jgi:uncharacterized protein YndB with AHSA1/START domain
MASNPLTVTARRRYDVPPDRLFGAFTDPALLTRWFSPSADISIEILAHELRPGGRYRFRYRQPSGEINIVTGEFCAISPPTRLVFTWTWEPPDPHAGIETLVTVDFVAEGTGTRVTVTHERFPDQESRDRHEKGWRTTLARLVAG